MKKIILLSSLFFLAISQNAVAQSKANLLCNAGWYKTAFTVTPAMQYWTNGNIETDLLASERKCTKDDYYVFNKNGTYQLLNNEIKCTQVENDIVSSGIWSFFNAENKTLRLAKSKSEGPLFYTILQLTTDKFSFTYTVTKNKVIYTFTETFEVIK